MKTKKIMVLALTLCMIVSLFTPMFSVTSFAASQPDLTITSAAVTQKTATQIKYVYTIKNIGTATISNLYNVTIQNFFSANDTFNDAGDVAAGGRILGVNRSLAPGQSYRATFYASGTVPAGKNNLIFKIDFSNSVAEANENDNTYILSALPGTTKMVNLRPEIEYRGIEVRDQGRGTCVLEALTFLQEYLLSGTYGSTYNHLSIEYAIQASNVATGSQSEDTCFREFHMGYSTYGAVTDAKWPYNSGATYNYDSWNAKFNTLTGTGANLLNNGYLLAGKCIREGYYGTLTDAEVNTIMGYLDRGIPVAQAHQGHSTAIIGYEVNSSYAGGGRFIYRNSWGTGFGDGGYSTYSFAELKQADINMALFVYERASSFPRIYRDIYYNGYSAALAPGSYTLDQLNNIGVQNDDISSIKVPSGYRVYLYQHNDFTGTCQVMTSNNDNFVNIGFNDEVSSIVVEKI